MPDPLGSFAFTWPFYAAALLGYLLGSIPFGLVLVRLAGLGDIRKIGSGNIGVTNVLRTGRKDLALLTLLLDGGKGAAAALAGAWVGGPDFAVLAGGGAVLGHSFPIWLKFRGGKGVATTLGTLLAVAPVVGAAACLAWLAVAAAVRISSVASLSATLAACLAAWLLRDQALWGYFPSSLQVVEFSAFLAVVVWLRHIANIRRLLAGTEPRFGEKRDDGTTAP